MEEGIHMSNSPTPIAVPSSAWPVVVGAIFGGITLVGLFFFIYVAGVSEKQFVCRSFPILAAAFSLGAALSAVFLGGAAAAQGKAAGPISFSFGVGGGVAVLVICFLIFSYFRPACSDNVGAQLRSLISGALTSATGMETTLHNAANFSQAAADNFSDSKTCAERGGKQKASSCRPKRRGRLYKTS
jgi:hypothetical protein